MADVGASDAAVVEAAAAASSKSSGATKVVGSSTVKGHGLASAWTFWFARRAQHSENYADGLQSLVHVDTVESFWLCVL